MSSAGAPRRLHVERTADPAVLSWVVHHPLLDASPVGRRRVPAGSAFGELVAAGSVTGVTVRHGAIQIATGDPDAWPALAPRVQRAILDELDLLDAVSTHWMLDATEMSPEAMLSIDEVQQVVDRAAGSVMASHGGALSVAAIDGDTVRLRSAGACSGCRQSDDTVIGLISPALREVFPEITTVMVDDGSGAPAHEPAPDKPTQRVGLRARLGGQRNSDCH